jgi:hypothetical protein
MRNRYYSVELGRFLTRDPLGVWGDGMNLGNEVGYAGNRPLVVGDPLGLQSNVTPGFHGPPTLEEHLAALERAKVDALELPQERPNIIGDRKSQHPAVKNPFQEGVNQLVGRVSGVLGFLLESGNLSATSEPFVVSHRFHCAYCGAECAGYNPCGTYACWQRRTSKRIRDAIRVTAPGFFGRNGLDAVCIGYTYREAGWVADKRFGRLWRSESVEIKLDVITAELEAHERVVLGGDLSAYPGGPKIR